MHTHKHTHSNARANRFSLPLYATAIETSCHCSLCKCDSLNFFWAFFSMVRSYVCMTCVKRRLIFFHGKRDICAQTRHQKRTIIILVNNSLARLELLPKREKMTQLKLHVRNGDKKNLEITHSMILSFWKEKKIGAIQGDYALGKILSLVNNRDRLKRVKKFIKSARATNLLSWKNLFQLSRLQAENQLFAVFHEATEANGFNGSFLSLLFRDLTLPFLCMEEMF